LRPKEVVHVPVIKPVSDLRNYPSVLKDVDRGEPVFLTKNGRGTYAILDLETFDRLAAEYRLFVELEKGRRSGEEEGWFTIDEVEKELGITHD